MRRARAPWRPVLALGVALVVASAGLAAPSQAAFAPTGRPQLAAFSHLAVDEPDGHLFFSQGTDTVVVTDLAGATVASLGSLPGSADLLMDPSGGTVWVALSTGAAVAAIDTTDLAVTTYPTGAGTCPRRLAVVDARVWFVSQCDAGAAELSVLTPGTGSATSVQAVTPDTVLAGSPVRPGRLYAAYPTESGAAAQVLNVAASPAQAPGVVAEYDDLGTPPTQITVVPDGSRLITSRGVVLRTRDLSLGRDRGEPSVETGVAVRADGQVAYGDDRRVHGFRLPGGAALVDLALAPAHVLPFGLGYGSHDLYVVTSDDAGYGVTAAPMLRASWLSVKVASHHVRYGHHVVVTVTATKAPKSGEIDLYARAKGGVARLVAQGHLGSHLRYQASYAVRADVTLTATFPGDDDWAPYSDSTQVGVLPVVAMAPTHYLRRSDTGYVYRAGRRAHFSLRVLPHDNGGCVRVHLERREAGHWRRLADTDCLPVPANGRVDAALGHTRSLVGDELRAAARLYPHPSDVPEAHTPWVALRFVR